MLPDATSRKPAIRLIRAIRAIPAAPPASSANSPRPPSAVVAVWKMPLLLGICIVIGLTTALIGGGFWHSITWLTLAMPLGMIAWHLRNAFSRVSAPRRPPPGP